MQILEVYSLARSSQAVPTSFRPHVPDSVRLLLDGELHKTRPQRHLSVGQRRAESGSAKLLIRRSSVQVAPPSLWW
jgi:hypothetical protein